MSDTSPLNYLVLIGHVDILPALFGDVIVPTAVRHEMLRDGTPDTVRQWISSPPSWLLVRTPSRTDDTIQLGVGEVEAISLAMELHADLLLMDDRVGRRAAESRGLSVAGTLNVLAAAAERDLLDLTDGIAKLRQTNFHVSERILAEAIAADTARRQKEN